MLTVLVVDDQPLFRELAQSMFESTGEFQVVAEAADGVDAIEAYSSYRPDLVLMDIQMARMNGIEATRHIMDGDPAANVVMISMRSDTEYARIAGEVGALAFIAKRDLDVMSIKRLIDHQRALVA